MFGGESGADGVTGSSGFSSGGSFGSIIRPPFLSRMTHYTGSPASRMLRRLIARSSASSGSASSLS
jgi:hypothetical protein